MRDAKADVTDMRAPGKTQRVRRKNRAFDLEAENEVRVFCVFRCDRRATRDLTARLTDFPDRRRRRVSEDYRSSGEPRQRRRDGARPEAVGGARGEAAKVLAWGQVMVDGWEVTLVSLCKKPQTRLFPSPDGLIVRQIRAPACEAASAQVERAEPFS